MKFKFKPYYIIPGALVVIAGVLYWRYRSNNDEMEMETEVATDPFSGLSYAYATKKKKKSTTKTTKTTTPQPKTLTTGTPMPTKPPHFNTPSTSTASKPSSTTRTAKTSAARNSSSSKPVTSVGKGTSKMMQPTMLNAQTITNTKPPMMGLPTTKKFAKGQPHLLMGGVGPNPVDVNAFTDRRNPPKTLQGTNMMGTVNVPKTTMMQMQQAGMIHPLQHIVPGLGQMQMTGPMLSAADQQKLKDSIVNQLGGYIPGTKTISPKTQQNIRDNLINHPNFYDQQIPQLTGQLSGEFLDIPVGKGAGSPPSTSKGAGSSVLPTIPHNSQPTGVTEKGGMVTVTVRNPITGAVSTTQHPVVGVYTPGNIGPPASTIPELAHLNELAAMQDRQDRMQAMQNATGMSTLTPSEKQQIVAGKGAGPIASSPFDISPNAPVSSTPVPKAGGSNTLNNVISPQNFDITAGQNHPINLTHQTTGPFSQDVLNASLLQAHAVHGDITPGAGSVAIPTAKPGGNNTLPTFDITAGINHPSYPSPVNPQTFNIDTTTHPIVHTPNTSATNTRQTNPSQIFPSVGTQLNMIQTNFTPPGQGTSTIANMPTGAGILFPGGNPGVQQTQALTPAQIDKKILRDQFPGPKPMTQEQLRQFYLKSNAYQYDEAPTPSKTLSPSQLATLQNRAKRLGIPLAPKNNLTGTGVAPADNTPPASYNEVNTGKVSRTQDTGAANQGMGITHTINMIGMDISGGIGSVVGAIGSLFSGKKMTTVISPVTGQPIVVEVQ